MVLTASEVLVRSISIHADVRVDRYCCRSCGATLADAVILRCSWRMIRSGDFAGDRSEYVTLGCTCGALRRLLWTVQRAPRLGG